MTPVEERIDHEALATKIAEDIDAMLSVPRFGDMEQQHRSWDVLVGREWLLSVHRVFRALLTEHSALRDAAEHVIEIAPDMYTNALQVVLEGECDFARPEGWRLVERYCESFKDDDFRLVFKRGDSLREISVGKETWHEFDAALTTPESLGTQLPATESAQRITHGRHCSCRACAAQDWTIGEPKLAPCGMHGPECPDEYQPLGRATESAQPEEERHGD